MKKVLIIGAAGFVGNHLIDYILENRKDWIVTGTKMPQETIQKNIDVRDVDITDIEQIRGLFADIQPEYVFHLAAMSSVAVSWKKPQLTVDINIKGSVNLLEVLKEQTNRPRVLTIGSGEEYGHIHSDEVPIREDNNTRPGNIYAATKVAQNLIGKIYSDAYHLDIMSTRSFNHTGPNQSPQFVVADFCKQVAEIENGLREPVMSVGNLSAKRDFTDVRDVVRAYCLLMEKGRTGETYNVGSGKAIEIRSILDMILAQSDRDIIVQVDPEKLRPVDVPIIEADITKLKEDTGWTPEIELEQTIRETLDVWRNQ